MSNNVNNLGHLLTKPSDPAQWKSPSSLISLFLESPGDG